MRWGALFGSKRKITEILTGDILPRKPDEKLADDILQGAQEISDFSGLKPRQIYHQKEKLGLRRLGETQNDAS
jgi:hypothetical protein